MYKGYLMFVRIEISKKYPAIFRLMFFYIIKEIDF